MNQMLQICLDHFNGTNEDRQTILDAALRDEVIKTSTAKDPKEASAPKDSKERGNSRWTAFQKAAKVRATLEEIKLTRPLTKAIWEAYTEDEKKEWDRVAKDLDGGAKILKIEHPKINFLQPIPQAEEATEAPAPAPAEAEQADEAPKMSKEQLEAALAALD